MIELHRKASQVSTSVLLFLAIISSFGCEAGEPSVSFPPLDRVILISIDTLRADFLGAYSPELDTTPHLDRFASESVVFTDVLSHASSTATSENRAYAKRVSPSLTLYSTT